MKQTAVEYLIDQLLPKALTAEQYYHIEQAKEMEKEQIIQAITKTIIGSNVIYGSEYPEVIHTADEYYNETFKSE